MILGDKVITTRLCIEICFQPRGKNSGLGWAVQNLGHGRRNVQVFPKLAATERMSLSYGERTSRCFGIVEDVAFKSRPGVEEKGGEIHHVTAWIQYATVRERFA